MSPETIFFSYSRVDSAFVLKLATNLRNAGFNIWLDQLDIRPGSRWDDSIQAALNQSGTLIVVLSPSSVASENVMDEVAFAIGEKKNVIPLLLTDCKPPFRLSRLQRVNFTGDYETGLSYLIETLDYHGARKQEPTATVKENVPPSPGVLDTNAATNEQQKEIDDGTLWQEAIDINSIASYTRYINESATGLHAEEAKQCINKFKTEQKNKEREKKLWNKSVEENSIGTYRQYLNEYPDGNYKEDALAAVNKLEEDVERQKLQTLLKKRTKPHTEILKKSSSKKYALIGGVVVLIGIIMLVVMKFNTTVSRKDLISQQIDTAISKPTIIADSTHHIVRHSQTDSSGGHADQVSTNFDDKTGSPRGKKVKAKSDANFNQPIVVPPNETKDQSVEKLEISSPHKIGDMYEGGIIFYIDKTGQHGLIAATSDQGSATWNDAVKICRDYNGGGYTDWHLPSKDEQHKLYPNYSVVGGFVRKNYWSSTEMDSGDNAGTDMDNAWTLCLVGCNGSPVGSPKDNRWPFRAVRAF